MKYKKTTLPNGLRVIMVPVKDSPTVTVMVAVDAGSNYESKDINGLSHFLEHMCFKGTTKRPRPVDIASEFDRIGAEHNAFTSTEYTGYYGKGEKRHFKKLLEVLSDMYLNPLFTLENIEKEKGVILQEISRVEDDPSKKVIRDIRFLMYGDTPAGRSTLGTPQNIRSFTQQDFIEYRDKHYVAEGTMIIVAGDVKENNVLKEVKKYFAGISTNKKFGKEKVVEKQKTPELMVRAKKTEQVNVAIGFRGFRAGDKRNVTAEVLQHILGEGMSSRLFQKLRTDLGICYMVASAYYGYTDHGALLIASGLEKKRYKEGIKAILEECSKFKDQLVSEEELEKTKGYMIGHLYLDLEATDSLADFYLDQEITKKKMDTPKEIEKQIRKVTPKDIQKVAKEIFQIKNLNLALIGDVKDRESVRKILKI